MTKSIFPSRYSSPPRARVLNFASFNFLRYNIMLNIWNHFVIISFLQVYACFMCVYVCGSHICGFSNKPLFLVYIFVYDFHVCQKSLQMFSIFFFDNANSHIIDISRLLSIPKGDFSIYMVYIYSFPTGHFCVIYIEKNYYSKNALVWFYIWLFYSYSICILLKIFAALRTKWWNSLQTISFIKFNWFARARALPLMLKIGRVYACGICKIPQFN